VSFLILFLTKHEANPLLMISLYIVRKTFEKKGRKSIQKRKETHRRTKLWRGI